MWQKEFSADPYPAIWTRARQKLADAKAIFVIGYSLPDTDVYTQAMLRIDVSELDFLCIVNPDDEARDRIKGALRSAILPSTFLIELPHFADLDHLVSG